MRDLIENSRRAPAVEINEIILDGILIKPHYSIIIRSNSSTDNNNQIAIISLRNRLNHLFRQRVIFREHENMDLPIRFKGRVISNPVRSKRDDNPEFFAIDNGVIDGFRIALLNKLALYVHKASHTLCGDNQIGAKCIIYANTRHLMTR